MKNIFMALMVIAIACTGAQAQTKKAPLCAAKTSHTGKMVVHTKRTTCGRTSDAVCRRGHCYKTRYAENFKVCKNENGYYICCERPNWKNSTERWTLAQGYRPAPFNTAHVQTTYVDMHTRYADTYQQYKNDVMASNGESLPATAPQNQSYPFGTTPAPAASSATSYFGYRPNGKGKIKVCYYGDNVAELNRNPYRGCDAPAFDGIEKNKVHNLNVSNTRDLPPIDGRIEP